MMVKRNKKMSQLLSCVVFISAIVFSLHTNFSFGQTNWNVTMLSADSLYSINSLDLAFQSYEKARLGFQNNNNWVKAANCLIKNGYIYYDLKKYKYAVNYIDSLIPLYERKLKNENPLIFGKILICLALNHRKNGDYVNALKSYETAILHYHHFNINDKDFAYALKNAAQIHERFLNYSTALNYNLLAIEKDSTNYYLLSIYSHIISNYNSLNEYDNAVKYYDKGVKLELNDKYRILLNGSASEAFYQIGNFEKVKKLAFENIELINTNKRYGYSPWIEYENLADTYNSQKKYKKAEYYYLKAIKEARIKYYPKDREVSKIEMGTGEYYFELGRLNQALSHYQQALIQVFPNFNSTDIADNPSIEDIYTESWIMTASARKGEALKARYDMEGDPADLINASQCFDLSIAGIQALKDSYGTDNAKLYLSDYSHDYFEQAIEVNYLLLKKTGKKEYFEKMFSIIEQSKASVLAEGIQKNRALILASLPDSLLKKESDFRFSLADLNKSIKMEELYGEERDREYISEMKSRRTTEQREYEALIGYLKNNYPEFRSYSEQIPTPSISQIQTYAAEKNAALIEYFAGEKHIYITVVQPGNSEVYQIERTEEWDGEIINFLKYFQNSHAIINDPDGYFMAAENMFKNLFPFYSAEKKMPENIIIIPDGSLNYIPFDALVKSRPTEPLFSQAGFLIRQHNIRYAYNAGLLFQKNETLLKKGIFIEIAPGFKNRERGLSPLLEDGENNYFKYLKGNNATLANFNEYAPKSKLVVLSTHAGASENDIEPSIEFIDTSLLLSELYAMSIPADLVVLSACETGLGKFEKGEGVMSLARGFAYAGTGSLIASLWKVNEKSTANIFNGFYNQLSDGKNKSEAMRFAKLNYIENAKSDIRMSPYYWASFVFIGQDGSLDIADNGFPFWVAGIGILLFIGLYFLWEKFYKK
ncbi:MAG TPA: CHAT domain-containing protein [Bacteroidetes bacterium]|nr:CHAT domain-containing protein [Bacteroidota bacterium]